MNIYPIMKRNDNRTDSDTCANAALDKMAVVAETSLGEQLPLDQGLPPRVGAGGVTHFNCPNSAPLLIRIQTWNTRSHYGFRLLPLCDHFRIKCM